MNTNSLFGSEQHASIVVKPEIPSTSELSRIDLLKREKELIGMFLSAHPLDDFKFEMENFITHKTTDLQDLASLKGRDVTIGGMVSAAKNNVSKNGKQWGLLSIEDYYGTYEIKLFGKDYEKFMSFMKVGHFLLVKASIQDRIDYATRQSTGEQEFKIKSINLLNNARDGIKQLRLNILLEELTEHFAVEIADTVKKNPGKIEFQVRMIDHEKNISVDLFSRKHRIEITQSVVYFLKHAGTEYEFT